MAVTVRIPTPLQKLTRGEAEIKANGVNVKELIENLEKEFPGIKDRICDEEGKIRKFINIYVNEEDVRFLQQDKTPLKDGDEVSIIPAIAGGSWQRAPLLMGPSARCGSSHSQRHPLPAAITKLPSNCVRVWRRNNVT